MPQKYYTKVKASAELYQWSKTKLFMGLTSFFNLNEISISCEMIGKHFSYQLIYISPISFSKTPIPWISIRTWSPLASVK